MKLIKLVRSSVLMLLIVWITLPHLVFASPSQALVPAAEKVDVELRRTLEQSPAGEKTRIIIHLRRRANLRPIAPDDAAASVTRALQDTAQNTQRPLLRRLAARQAEGKVGEVQPLWIINAISAAVTPAIAAELAAMREVERITPDEIDIIPAAETAYAAPRANLTAIGAQGLWERGYFGQGVVVATMDTGASLSHPQIAARWRGGNNSWYDPFNQYATPVDVSGHGTQTLGVIVGGEADGASFGVAPQAQWIAVKIFTDRGASSATAVHLGFQWLLDPDGNPTTRDAPQVVNNSWSMGGPRCNLEFQQDLRALRAAGILPIFAAGNYGPNGNTSVSPANYPEALAVGAVDNSGGLYAKSSRGPSACGETSTVYPEIVAPGVNVYTTDRSGLYIAATGTSLSAPHVAGTLALLLSAFPNLATDHQAAALTYTAVDLGAPGPDNQFGFGRLDALAAFQWLQNSPGDASPTPTVVITETPTPTSAVTETPTAIPTATATPVVPTAAATHTPTATPSATAIPVTASPTAGSETIFSDGFESGGLTAWSSAASDGGRLSVGSLAGLSGAFGLQATINSTIPVYVRDERPTAETRYHARFEFSPNGVSIPDRGQQDLFQGLTGANRLQLRIQIRAFAGGYQIRAATRSAAGAMISTNWASLSNGVHAIEVIWNAASTTTATDGMLALWLDGVNLQTLNNLTLGTDALESIQLGPQALATGITGTEYFDGFISTRGAMPVP